MYDTMVYRETAHTARDQPSFVRDFARQRQAAVKIAAPEHWTSRAALEPRSNVNSCPTQSGSLKAHAQHDIKHDITVGGPERAVLWYLAPSDFYIFVLFHFSTAFPKTLVAPSCIQYHASRFVLPTRPGVTRCEKAFPPVVLRNSSFCIPYDGCIGTRFIAPQ